MALVWHDQFPHHGGLEADELESLKGALQTLIDGNKTLEGLKSKPRPDSTRISRQERRNKEDWEDLKGQWITILSRPEPTITIPAYKNTVLDNELRKACRQLRHLITTGDPTTAAFQARFEEIKPKLSLPPPKQSLVCDIWDPEKDVDQEDDTNMRERDNGMSLYILLDSTDINLVLLQYFKERKETMDIDPPYDERTFTGYGDDNVTGRDVISRRQILEWPGKYAEPGRYRKPGSSRKPENESEEENESEVEGEERESYGERYMAGSSPVPEDDGEEGLEEEDDLDGDSDPEWVEPIDFSDADGSEGEDSGEVQ